MVIQMKFFHAALVMLAITALGVGQSAAQTGAPSPGGMGATSPLGADFGQTPGSSQSSTVPFAGVAFPRLARGEVLTPPLCPLSTAAH
jgi:hypothetical protein